MDVITHASLPTDDCTAYNREQTDKPVEPLVNVPRHVAIIMDGNNRWSKRHGKSRLSGHKAGVEAVRRVLEGCRDHGVETLTLFTFSSENWQRSQDEVRGLMNLFYHALRHSEIERLREQGIRLKVIGDISRFNAPLRQQIRHAESRTACNSAVTLVIAASYGGRWDITQAAQRLAFQVQEGRLAPEAISADLLEKHLATGEISPPDLLIRTSGECRISNFLLWQCAYSEFYFTDVLWPDFGQEQFARALHSYSQRQRRFGGSHVAMGMPAGATD